MATPNSPTVAAHFDRREPVVAAIYRRLLAAARRLGPVVEDPKQTSIHLVRRSAFAGVATRKAAVIVTLKAVDDLDSPRVVKRVKASARRWYLEIRLESPADVDAEFRAWLRDSWNLSD